MRNNKKRGILASAGALITAAAFALGSAGAAYAASVQPAPETSDVVITKLKQGDTLRAEADGTPQDVNPTDLLNNVKFEAYLVPGTENIGTNAGQQAAALIDVATAIAATQGDTPAAQGVTGLAPNPAGQVVWNDLTRGLYLVKEDLTTLPQGVTAAAPFLLAVPLTDPTNNDAWLDTIYVYPKNSVVSGVKTVENAEQLVVGSDVTWTIATDIPLVQNPQFDTSEPVSESNQQFTAPDAFRIDDTLRSDELALVGAPEVTVAGVVLSSDNYSVTPVAVGANPDVAVDPDTNPQVATRYQIEFNVDGRAALAAAVNADAAAKVEITLVTTVLKADEITNKADFYPNQNAITSNKPVPVTPAVVKYGSQQVNKLSTDGDADLAGAQFQVFASLDDALALTNPLAPAVTTENYDAATRTWTTPASGEFVIEGLRFSNFADGEEQLPYLTAEGGQTADEAQSAGANPKFQTYYLVETVALEDHQLLAEPIPFTITSTDATAIEFDVTNQHNTGGFVLPLTGGMGTALLTVGGIAILAIVLLVARSRRNEEAIAE